MFTYLNRVLDIKKENVAIKPIINMGFLTAYSILSSISLIIGISKLEKLLFN